MIAHDINCWLCEALKCEFEARQSDANIPGQNVNIAIDRGYIPLPSPPLKFQVDIGENVDLHG
jgi:hypothetical protein